MPNHDIGLKKSELSVGTCSIHRPRSSAAYPPSGTMLLSACRGGMHECIPTPDCGLTALSGVNKLSSLRDGDKEKGATPIVNTPRLYSTPPPKNVQPQLKTSLAAGGGGNHLSARADVLLWRFGRRGSFFGSG